MVLGEAPQSRKEQHSHDSIIKLFDIVSKMINCLPVIYVHHYDLHLALIMSLHKVISDPCNHVVFEHALDKLMQ